jgi:transcriptional repressor NrdR
LKCGKRFTTIERVELDLNIIKKDGKREKFSREKLVRGLARSLEKRPLAKEQIEKLVEDIVTNVYRIAKDKDIKSSRIGEIVMSNLKKVDKVAYVRFAAVYRDFADVEEFMEELKKLK